MSYDLHPVYCQCCEAEIKGNVINANPWEVANGVYYTFCSNECVEHCAEQHQEYLDSYDV